jgi:hypothetical protein
MPKSISWQDRVATLRVVPSLPDHRNAMYAAMPQPDLPSSASLGVDVPVKDQRRQGSCTGHGYAEMVEALLLIAGKPYVPKSPAFIYAEERILEGDLDQDAGAQPIDGCKVLASLGVCDESDMPYSDQVYNETPPDAAIKAAVNCRIGGYALCGNTLAVKSAIYNRHPVGFGIAVYESFETVGKDGVVPMPGLTEKPLGGHWVFGGISYQDDKSTEGGGAFFGHNSWSESWGCKGGMFIPYAYVDNASYCFEARAVWL